MIRKVEKKDIDAIRCIYNYYIKNTTITFEEMPISSDEVLSRVNDIIPDLPYLVSEEDDKVVGYAYATKWKGRCAYKYSVETTVYIDKANLHKGIGTQLYLKLLAELRARGYHRAIGGIALPNEGSIALHEKLGFSKVAHFSEVGNKFDRWIDVGYWEYKL